MANARPNPTLADTLRRIGDRSRNVLNAYPVGWMARHVYAAYHAAELRDATVMRTMTSMAGLPPASRNWLVLTEARLLEGPTTPDENADA